MSMSEPFMPIDEPVDTSKPTDRDLEIDGDVFFEQSTDDPDELRAAHDMREHAENTPFRTPSPGARLTASELRADLNPERGQ